MDWIKEQLNEGLEIYIYIREKYFNDRFDHIIVPQLNIEGLCENIREGHYDRTMDLHAFDALGNEKDSGFLSSLAKSLELDKYASLMQYATELRNGDELRTSLADNSVLAIKKLKDGKYYTSVIDLDSNATVVKSWDINKGYTEQKIYSRTLPYIRQGCATGDTIEESLVKSALIYNTEKSLEHIEYFKNALKSMNESQSEAE